MAAQRFGDGLMQGNLRRAQQARAQSIRERRTKDRDRMEDLPTLEQFRTGNAYACMTLCVCVCVCVAASRENMSGSCMCYGCHAFLMSHIPRVLQVFTTP